MSSKFLFDLFCFMCIYIYIPIKKSGICRVLFLKEGVSYQFIPKLSNFKANCYLFCLFVFLLVCLLVFFK